MKKENGEVYTRVATLENTFEAQLLGSILDENGMEYRIRSFHDTAYDGLFQVQKGWGEISAPASLHEGILEILSDIRSNQSDSA